MIILGIVWFILFMMMAAMISQELINGTIEWRFWIIVLLIFILIFTAIVTLDHYIRSYKFYKEFIAYQAEAAKFTQMEETVNLSDIVNYNYRLYQYQTKSESILPNYYKIYDLASIQAKSYDVAIYEWWH